MGVDKIKISNRITKKLIKYFTGLIAAVVLMSMIVSSVFLSKVYMSMQYNSLKDAAREIYNDLKSGDNISKIQDNVQISSAILINKDRVEFITPSRMGIMPFLKSIEAGEIKEKGIFKNPMREEFLYYKYHTDIGDIIVLQNNKFSAVYTRAAYTVLLIVFIIAILVSIPLISHVGGKFTGPILKLQKASRDISRGNFDADFKVDTGDEIEDLSQSLVQMGENLKKKDNLQKQFIANVSHDFKTPLSVIRNYSEAIYDGIVEGEERKVYSKEIIYEVDKLNHMVMDLLELSKLQEGSYRLNLECFNIANLLKDSCNTYKRAAEAKKVQINLKADDVEIDGDFRYLSRVVNNFIDNAVKFSHEGGIVEVRTAAVGNGIKISVRDYGIGIQSDMLENIWTRYYKHKESGGMGLGLAICKEILDMHGFDYGVESEKGKGTEFNFNVPKEYIR